MEFIIFCRLTSPVKGEHNYFQWGEFFSSLWREESITLVLCSSFFTFQQCSSTDLLLALPL
jgi:hypothetical protein